MRGSRWGNRLAAVGFGIVVCVSGAVLFAQDPAPDVTKSAKTKIPANPKTSDDMPKPRGKKSAGKGTSKKAQPEVKKAEPPIDDGSLKFSRDIAPIFVGNCIGCHNPRTKARNGQFDLSTFNALMAGGKSGKVIVGGKPEESHLVELVATEDMPRGNRGKLSAEAVGRIEKWVKAGAILDANVDPAAPLEKIAATPEQIRQRELAKLSPEERDKKIEEAGLERWKKASAKTTPVVTTSKNANFILISNLPKPRVDRLMKTMESQRTLLINILGKEGGKGIASPEKISLYVFNDLTSYVEFVRSNENREIESGVECHGRLDVEHPYIAAADPLLGADEAAPSGKKASSKSKKAADSDDSSAGNIRSLAGLISESLGSSATVAAGKPPKWLSSGLGAFLSSKAEPSGNPYYDKLRRTAAQQAALGWAAKASEALSPEADLETARAVGFSLCEWMSSSARAQFPYFVQNMLLGGEKLDDAIRACFGDDITRQQFLDQWESFIISKYGTGRRR